MAIQVDRVVKTVHSMLSLTNPSVCGKNTGSYVVDICVNLWFGPIWSICAILVALLQDGCEDFGEGAEKLYQNAVWIRGDQLYGGVGQTWIVSLVLKRDLIGL